MDEVYGFSGADLQSHRELSQGGEIRIDLANQASGGICAGKYRRRSGAPI
jgi:hypothetical protein